MKAVILAGGLGTRLQEETTIKPKPMVEIGGHPILWHIMKVYSHFDINEFVIALGYKGEIIKNYFLNYHYYKNNISIDLKNGEVIVKHTNNEDWKIHLIDTGIDSGTGGRLLRLKSFLSNESFFMTYGDGLSDINMKEQLIFHKNSGKMATVTAVRPPARFGRLSINKNHVAGFQEKPQASEGWINGGFFILNPSIFDLLKNDEDAWEGYPMKSLSSSNELNAYQHLGFWQCMDTLRDVNYLNNLWNNGKAPWKVWN